MNEDAIDIETEDLSYHYSDGTVALRDVGLKIYRGEFLAVVGQNGSGKTTLAKHLNWLFRPSSGCVKVLGVMSTKASISELASKSAMFQNPDQHLCCRTVEEELSFGPRNLGLSEDEVRERVNEVIGIFRLEGFRKNPPSFWEKLTVCDLRFAPC